MIDRNYTKTYRLDIGNTLTHAVKYLIIANIAIFGLIFITGAKDQVFYLFGLVPAVVFRKLYIWQFMTYMFLHAGFFHLFFNMFVLWMFGSKLEKVLGTREFLVYYFITGVGAGIFNWIFSFNSPVSIVGASGAIYGILVAYAMFFPNSKVFLYFIIPVKVKYVVFGLAFIEFFASFQPNSFIAHLAHLGGMVIGFIYIKYKDAILQFFPQNSKQIQWKGENHPNRRPINSGIQGTDFSDKRKVIDIVDIILDKINREGYESLTDQERSILKQASDVLSEDKTNT